MRRLFAISILLAIALGSLAVPSAATEDFQEAELPDTPAGKQFKAFLIAVESGDHEEYIRNNFNQDFMNAFPMEAHLRFFQDVRTTHGGFLVHSIQRSSDFRIVVLAKSEKRDAWRRIDMGVEPEPPHKVAGLGIDPSGPPTGDEDELRQMTEEGILKYIENELAELSGKDEFSGAVLVAKDAQPLFRRAYGEASKEFDVPNRPDTKFNIGSINKSFTMMAIAQLMEQGRIDLDDRIGKYLPDLPNDWGERITVRHLLTMRSGLGHYWNEEWQSKFAEIKTVDALMDVVVKSTLDFEPGTRKQYSNSGFVVLGAIIESVTGQSYYDYVKENIYEPAGMADTDSYELDQIVPNLARGYTVNRSETPYGGKELQNNLFMHSIKGSPAGGGCSTLDDLNRYVEALKAGKLAGEKYTNMALGVFENVGRAEDRPKGLGIAGGADVGINAIVEADFITGYTVIVLSNYDPPTAEELGIKYLRMLANSKD